jgi:hypothetical protein
MKVVVEAILPALSFTRAVIISTMVQFGRDFPMSMQIPA